MDETLDTEWVDSETETEEGLVVEETEAVVEEENNTSLASGNVGTMVGVGLILAGVVVGVLALIQMKKAKKESSFLSGAPMEMNTPPVQQPPIQPPFNQQ